MKNRLKVYRAMHNLTQENLAKELKVTRQTIIAIEKLKYDPSLRLAFKIAKFFKVKIEDIFIVLIIFFKNQFINIYNKTIFPKLTSKIFNNNKEKIPFNKNLLNSYITYNSNTGLKIVDTSLKKKKDYYYMNEAKYKAKFSKNLKKDNPIKYEYENYYLSFTPKNLKWSNNEKNYSLKNVNGNLIENEKSVNGKDENNWAGKGIIYKNAFGKGIDLGVITKNTEFEKILKINSLENLGKLPENSEYLELSFNLNSNKNLEYKIYNENNIWNKKSNWHVKGKAVEFGIKGKNKSYIKPGKIWDSKGKEESIEFVFSNKNGKLCLTKKIPKEFLKTACFPVYTDANITFGSEYVFNPAITSYISTAKLDSTHFVVCYRDDASTGRGTACVGTISEQILILGLNMFLILHLPAIWPFQH